MWGWISGSKSPAVNLPVNVGEEVGQCLAGRLVFKLHTASHKTSKEPLSVFKFESSPSTTPEQLAAAKAEFKRLRVLRHPSVVKYVDGVDSEALVVIVTEPVTPLLHYIQNDTEQLSAESICWGLHQLITALNFLHTDCKIPHRNLYSSSVFIAQTGDWKLGGVAWCEETSPLSLPSRVNQYLSKYDAPEVLRGVNTSPTTVDIWQLGVLIWEIFNGNMSSPQSLRDTSNIPAQLLPVYRECVSSNYKSRPTIGAVLEKLAGTYFKNSFVSANIFLDELSMKERGEKEAFFTQLPDKMDTFPENFSKYKLLPALTTTFEFGDVGVEVLATLFKLGKLLNEEEYKAKILPCIIKLFSSTDRAMRIQLLTQLHNFIEYLDNKTVDSQIFPAVSTGFTDTIPGMREQTVKAMLQLTAKLSESTIDNQLLKYLAKAQTDTEPPIRTNTTICISKICCHFSDATRRKVLLPAFLRSLKDPFLHARNAGLLSLGCTSQYYGEPEVASRILPAVCPLLMDHERIVREQALKTVRHFLEKVERYHKGVPDEPPPRKPVQSGKGEESGSVQEGAGAAKGWASWAVSSVSNITSKYTTTQEPQKIGEIQKPAHAAAAATTGTSPAAATAVKDTAPLGKAKESSKPHQSAAVSQPAVPQSAESDGWDEGWDDIPPPTIHKTKSTMKLGGPKAKTVVVDDDSLIDSILKEEQGSLKLGGSKPNVAVPKSSTEFEPWDTKPQNNKVKLTPLDDQGQNGQLLSSYFSDNSSDFFGQMGVSEPAKPRGPVKSEWDDFNLKVTDEPVNDGNDWGAQGVSEKTAKPPQTNIKTNPDNRSLASAHKLSQSPRLSAKPVQKSASPTFDEWGDDWGNSKTSISKAQSQKPSVNKPVQKPVSSFDSWGNNDWGDTSLTSSDAGNFNQSSTKTSGAKSAASFDSLGATDWGEAPKRSILNQSVPKSGSSNSTKSTTADDWDSGWDNDPKLSREEKRRQQRERRANKGNKLSGMGATKKT